MLLNLFSIEFLRQRKLILPLLLFLPFLSACAIFQSSAPDPDQRRVLADNIASAAGMQAGIVVGGGFRFQTYSRLIRPGEDVVVYIEGDGLAWATRYRRSENPTPVNPVALKLAAKDPSLNVVYLARPCQFVNLESEPLCSPTLWTDQRFSGQVVAAMNVALDAAPFNPGSRKHLVGYSGGGSIAALVAARRNDIASLRTIAGNLDHVALSEHHGVTVMQDSLNPIDIAPSLDSLPQIHFSGGKDSIVPATIALRFIERLTTAECARHVILPDATHSAGWLNYVQHVQKIPAPCVGAMRR